MKKILLLTLWFPLSISLLAINIALLHQISLPPAPVAQPISEVLPTESILPVTAVSAGTAQVLGAQVIAADARSILLKQFLAEHNSPMLPYADLIVAEADRFGIDFRLIVSIAMCESNLGKHMPSSGSHNAWGIAVYTGQQTGANFKDWPTAIAWVSQYIKEKYYDKGIVDLKKISAIYAPPSVETGYSWANCVETFQEGIK